MKISVSRDYLLTYITEFLVIVSGVFIYRLAAVSLNTIDFALYAIIRRTVSLLLPLVMIGVAVGIPRYVALTEQAGERDTYFISGSLLALIVYLIVLIPALIFNKAVSFLILSSVEYSGVLLPLLLMTGALLLHSSIYSYLRGRIMMNHANLLQLINVGTIPLAGFLFFNDLVSVLYMTALGWAVVSFIFFLLIFNRITIKYSLIKPQIKELLNYGSRRVPGDIMLAGFFAFPAFIVSHLSGVEEAGNVAFAVTLVTLAGSFFGPVSLLLLPEAAGFIKQNNYQGLKDVSRKLLGVTLLLTIIGVVIFMFLGELFLDLYLKTYSEGLVTTVKVVSLGSVGYCVYVVERSMLDAVSVKGLNTMNIFYSFLIFGILCSIILLTELSVDYLIYSFVAGCSILGILTYKKLVSYLNSFQ